MHREKCMKYKNVHFGECKFNKVMLHVSLLSILQLLNRKGTIISRAPTQIFVVLSDALIINIATSRAPTRLCRPTSKLRSQRPANYK